ncbi:MAG: purine-nucleoside phosphorylase [Nanoarchaeota archaeon]|nr:purine-nucleoside phosphorylase [Nanoarchaeota archaeon]
MTFIRLMLAADYQENYEKKVGETVDFLRGQLGEMKPEFGLVLGSGLDDLSGLIEIDKAIEYKDIPNFPTPTVAGHEGKLYVGSLEGVPIIGLKGRKHYYEVADEPLNTGMLQVIFPVHVLAGLGVKNYFPTNASGGLNPGYDVGDVMVIRSHINMIPNPLLGRHMDFKTLNGERVARFPPMNEAYDPELTGMLLEAGKSLKGIREGKYLAVTGPTYETSAECIAFRDGLLADAVGMSTAPEVIVANSRGLKVTGFSVITNKIDEDGINATSHDEVLKVLASPKVRTRLTSLVRNFFREYNNLSR